ncbi:cysteine synthase A [Alkalithermobacter thermoalcaliphilus JW-YL-7 = DSM 7308]|uniref:Cysteine synthase n=1 Tax=Alkalithermobacter thermoalcaliphilus JW-YL-7 = DSM 7308 TaxID=1121328 RepID=A0A150FP61_CLOPD|nr:cysteine synthase A [[Clostridium] paradoxum JW-YL-7 = DSM 7308]SHL27352.1 cysteine synthase A [[Clostridium] paradoxum JW-YL-7 = DSM 7308]
MIYNNIGNLIGNTPIVKLNNIVDDNMANIYVKLEFFNPGGSVKDRIALNMIEKMEERGILKKGYTIVEPTSGNTGIGIAMVCAYKGYDVILVMPETMSIERRKILSGYGAKLVLTEGSKGMKGAVEKACELVSKNENYVMLSQFENMDNPDIHRKATAVEILNDFGKNIDAFVAGVGTGGTITGVGQVLKKEIPNIKIVAVEPLASPVLSGGTAGPHKIQGIGAGFIPKVLDRNIIDKIIKISNEESFEMARNIAKKEGLFLGISSGAAIAAAYKLAKELGKGKNIVVISPDNGERYLSTDLYE